MEPYVTVVDVYEAASDIGRDLEQLAEKYGSDCIDKLVPKICLVLEQLEQSVVRSERETVCRGELQSATEQMELARQERKQARLRHETELGQLESEWHQEVTELTATMDALIEENEQLRKRMDWQKSAKADADLAPSASGGAVEDGLLALTASMSTGSVSTYKEAIAKNKEEIRAKMRDIEELQLMLANALADAEKQTAAAQVQKKRNKNLQNQARKLMEEKSQLTIQVRENMLQIISLEHDMRALQLEHAASPGSAPLRLPALVADKSSASGSDQNPEDAAADAPRFTLNELRSLINERNQLKVKVMELQDELTALKAASTISPSRSIEKCTDSMEEVDLDAPVQGPINREPDEKLWSPTRRKNKESTIRSLFRGLFGETGLSQGIFYNLKEGAVHLAD